MSKKIDFWDSLKRENNTKPYQKCTTCDKDGHTYLACDKINFFEAFQKELTGNKLQGGKE